MAKDRNSLSRRRFLHAAASIAPAVIVPLGWPSAAAARAARQLALSHTLWPDELLVQYRAGDAYEPAALARVNNFLRDPLTQEVCNIDPALLDFLHDVYVLTESKGRFEVISGYRSPATNEMMRRRNSGVARNSQHTLGRAIDVRLTDVDTGDLRDAAISLRRGGVGYYADTNFVHLDTGRVRRW